MRVLLVDDEELQLLRLKDVVTRLLPEAEIVAYANPVLAWEEQKTTPVDIAFLDIQMPVLSGIMLAKKLKSVNPRVNVIFVTAHTQFALEAYRIHASGYITKPVGIEQVEAELDGLRYPVALPATHKLQIKCFGNFEVFSDGIPVKFARSKSKELFAYLVDREGAAVNVNELNAILWEEDKKSYFRNLIADIQTTLKSVGAESVFCKRHSECFIDPSQVDCDAYRYKANDPDAIRSYRGEYMSQYDWAIFQSDDTLE